PCGPPPGPRRRTRAAARAPARSCGARASPLRPRAPGLAPGSGGARAPGGRGTWRCAPGDEPALREPPAPARGAALPPRARGAGSPGSVPGEGSTLAAESPPPPFLDRVPTAPSTVLHGGARHVYVSYLLLGQPSVLEYDEHVYSDGQGRFKIVPGAVTSPPMT